MSSPAGGFNNTVLKKAETRIQQLHKLGLNCVVISVEKKGNAFFSRKGSVRVDSELAARMAAMSNAPDNAVELKKNLSVAYNHKRQAKIRGEILEIVTVAEALTPID
ncbi:hypothetical protein Ahy_B08g092779 [Arachis hypogaea]|uniref:Uncharacterized protein n=1 Tax=Arachis hypogaea TaxID=3818 RepID=A0A444Y4M3_ARAHY|nr:hypothetical protein Ahy_B08g092779 [Arachis hypogaea]